MTETVEHALYSTPGKNKKLNKGYYQPYNRAQV